MLATGKPVPEVAQEYGFLKHTFYRVINGERHNQAVRDLIAGLVKRSVPEIWPTDPLASIEQR